MTQTVRLDLDRSVPLRGGPDCGECDWCVARHEDIILGMRAVWLCMMMMELRWCGIYEMVLEGGGTEMAVTLSEGAIGDLWGTKMSL